MADAKRGKIGKSRGVVTDEWVEKGKKNLAKGREKKEAQRAKARAEGAESATSKWARLLDGTMSVRELDDEELSHMRPRGADGGFGGGKRPIPSHIAQQMRNEMIRRAQHTLLTSVGDAAKAMQTIVNDPDAKDADKIRAGTTIMDRVLGKPDQTVRIESESEWDKAVRKAFAVDRDLDDLIRESSDADAPEGSEA